MTNSYVRDVGTLDAAYAVVRRTRVPSEGIGLASIESGRNNPRTPERGVRGLAEDALDF